MSENKKKAWKKFLPHTIVGLVALGVGMGLGTTKEVIVEKPVEVVKEVAGPATIPTSCLTALKYADEEFLKMANVLTVTGDIFGAIQSGDFETANAQSEVVIDALADVNLKKYREQSDACQAEAGK